MSPKKAVTGPVMPGAVWLRERPPRRGQHGLTRERIAAEVVSQLDRAGLDGLNLRAVAAALDVHATTLYWHVSVRDDLLDLAVDAVFGEMPLPSEPAHDWVDEVRSFMHNLRAALLAHPWSGALASSRPLIGPEALARSEYVYAALSRAGFTDDRLAAAAAAVTNLVIGSVAAEASWQHDSEPAARQAVHEHLQANAQRYPTMSTLAPRAADWSTHFAYSAELLLEGLQAPEQA
ncbi:TetR family transcriptional regulator (plasmid) [Pseudonocardia sp. EC080610-09]|uniref:TetR/AcrR family transcriptional regulator n=1 Tax=unclassified Pseudonocardia TaxID=2619320 RepID=UPI0007058D2B|nr:MULTISPECIES: TetR/AcrR family transcriptional regulator C-terminal domain-containing protein [unclassified Pseudonocardia]ALL79498.1 TetR family transcriptional regulator [Pseudonocardia sp. EC080610-09]ALL85778.1 TetR family transcriptional regulator [Pseudonocardia sp. EC080619-01]